MAAIGENQITNPNALVNLLRDQGAYFGKGTKGWFFGSKLHVLATQTGQIVGAVLLPTSYDDRAGVRMLASLMNEGSLCLADLGYRGTAFQLDIYEEEGVLFLTRADMTSHRLKILHSLIRERVEVWARICHASLFKKLAGIMEKSYHIRNRRYHPAAVAHCRNDEKYFPSAYKLMPCILRATQTT